MFTFKSSFQKISSSVEMKDNSSSAVRVTYYTSGLTGGAMKQTNKCDGLKVGSNVKFEAEIEVTSCPKNRKEWEQIFQIYPVGISESLIVELTMLCDCPCERPNHSVGIRIFLLLIIHLPIWINEISFKIYSIH